MTESLATKAVRGISWTALATGSTTALSFVVQIVLARLLVPEHFGLLSMAIVVTSVAEAFNEFGLGAALIQRREEELSKEQTNTAFWASAALGVALFVLLALVVGPLAAYFFDEPVLRWLIPVMSLSLLINPWTLLPRILLTRQMRFKALGWVSVVQVLSGSAVALVMAWQGFGVWSLAALGVVGTAATIPVLYGVTKWRPERVFSKEALRQLFGFGSYVTAQSILTKVTKNLDALLLGKLLGAQALGYYTLAFVITDTLRQRVMGVMNAVMYPVYSRLQDERERAAAFYLAAVRFNTVVLFPLMVGLICVADPGLVLVVGDDWSQAIVIAQVLAMAMMVHAAGGTSSMVMRGLGRPDLEVKIYVVKTVVITVPLLLVGITQAGLLGAAWAIFGVKLASRIIAQYFMRKLLGVTELQILLALLPAVVAGGTVYAVFFGLGQVVALDTLPLLGVALLLALPLSLAVGYVVLDKESKGFLRELLRKK